MFHYHFLIDIYRSQIFGDKYFPVSLYSIKVSGDIVCNDLVGFIQFSIARIFTIQKTYAVEHYHNQFSPLVFSFDPLAIYHCQYVFV